MREIIREEKKYLITIYEYMKYKHLLEQVLPQDDHNGLQGYQVRSLYFDTLYNKDFYDKVEGLESRRKIRLRTYNPENDFALLEMKQKQGIYQIKRSLKLSKGDARKLIQGDYLPLLQYDNAFARECYGIMTTQSYSAKSIIEYTRCAYQGNVGGTRVTFDFNLRMTESNMDLFAKELNIVPVLSPDYVILEVKYSEFLLNHIKNILNCYEKSELSVSKYILSRQISL